jgi:hypothetical protein
LAPGPFDLQEARADQADLDRLLLHGRVNPDLEAVRSLRLRLRDGLARAIDVDPEGTDANPEGLPRVVALAHLPPSWLTVSFMLEVSSQAQYQGGEPNRPDNAMCALHTGTPANLCRRRL